MVMHAGGQGSATATTVAAAAFPLLASNGNAAAPSYSFASDPDTGFYSTGNNNLFYFSSGSTPAFAFTQGATSGLAIHPALPLSWTSTDATGTSDTMLFRDGSAATLALKNANTAQEFRVYAGNGSYVSPIKSVNESLTIAASATTDSATTVPAGSVVIACGVRVLTAIPTAANFTMTMATGGTTLSTAAVSSAANTTDKGTAGGVFYQSAASKVRITPNATPANTTGSVRLCIYYYDVVAPTS